MTDQSETTPEPDTSPINHVALWAMITGVLGWVFITTPTPFSLVAIVLGHIGLSQTKGKPGRNRAFAIAGLVLGYSGIALLVILLALVTAVALPVLPILFGGVPAP